MAKEIRRSNWSRFCKKFNQTNQYRRARVSFNPDSPEETPIYSEHPFMGISTTRKGRLIDGIALYTGQFDSSRSSTPQVMIQDADRIMSVEGKDGDDQYLKVTSKDGSVLEILLEGAPDRHQQHALIERLAYSIAEEQGFPADRDADNWLEAERHVRQAELILTE